MMGRKFIRKLQYKQIGKVYTSSMQLNHVPCQRVSLAGSRRRCPVWCTYNPVHRGGSYGRPICICGSVAEQRFLVPQVGGSNPPRCVKLHRCNKSL